MFCESPFTVRRQQLDNKQNIDVAPHGKISADAQEMGGCSPGSRVVAK